MASVTLSEGPNVIWREAMNRRFSIDASIQGRDLGSVVADIKKGLKNVELPQDYYVVFGGQFQNQQRAMKSLLLATAIALAVVFMLLFVALGSASQALIILATVPSAFIGGVASLLITGETPERLLGGRLHRAVRHRGPEQPGAAHPDQRLHRRGAHQGAGDPPGERAAAAAEADDRLLRGAGPAADPAERRSRRGDREAAGDRDGRRAGHLDAVHAAGAAGRLLWSVERIRERLACNRAEDSRKMHER